jgi:hypothetical protein
MPKKKKQEQPICVVECPDGFNDFSILKQVVKNGERVEVTEVQFEQMKRSAPSVVCVEKRLNLSPEAAAKIAEGQERRDAEKEAIRKKYEKDAPPRRKVGKPAPLPMTNTAKPVSPSELVNLPVTKDD